MTFQASLPRPLSGNDNFLIVLNHMLKKITFKIFLYLNEKLSFNKIEESQGSILILADLLLGDLAMAGFVIQSIIDQHPQRKIVLLCKEEMVPVAALFLVDKVIGAREINWGLLNQLKSESPEGYGLIINIFSGKWLKLINATKNGRIISYKTNKEADKYITEFRLFPSNPRNTVDIMLDLYPEKVQKSKIKLNYQIIKTFKTNYKNYIVIHIGAGTSPRLWPASLLLKTINLILNANNKIILTGFSQDSKFIGSLQKIILGNEKKQDIKNLLGKTKLLQLISILKNSQGLISFDTGVIHWARLMSIKTFSILGQTDFNLFGANSKKFTKAFEIKTESLDCQNENIFHGSVLPWMKNCHREECIKDSIECIENIGDKKFTSTLISFLEIKKIN